MPSAPRMWRCSELLPKEARRDFVCSAYAEMLQATSAAWSRRRSAPRVRADAPPSQPPTRQTTESAPRGDAPKIAERHQALKESAPRTRRCSGDDRGPDLPPGVRSAYAEMIPAIRVHQRADLSSLGARAGPPSYIVVSTCVPEFALHTRRCASGSGYGRMRPWAFAARTRRCSGSCRPWPTSCRVRSAYTEMLRGSSNSYSP